MGKVCELCGERATVFCNADDAELCWSCDAGVHGANYLVARHMRLVLCSGCGAQTECQTSGPSPCPLKRSCYACNPAHDEQKVSFKGSAVLDECNDDSEETPAAVSKYCASQGSFNDAHSSVEDESATRKSESSRGRPKRMRGEAGSRGAAAAAAAAASTTATKCSLQSRKRASGRKSRRKGGNSNNGGSQLSVVSVDNLGSNRSFSSDISLEIGMKTTVLVRI